MVSKLQVTLHDYGTPSEKSTSEFRGVTLTAGNFDAQNTLMSNLVSALNGLTLGNIIKTQRVSNVVESPETQVGMSPFSQRETKWLVRYHDTTSGNKFTLEIPTADLALLDPDNSDKILMTGAEAQAFKTAFEAYHISPDGAAAVLDEILFVGRRT